MATKVAVVPLRAGMKLRHPIDGLLLDEGSDWTNDQFTAVLLREHSIFRADDESPRPELHRFNEGEQQPPEPTKSERREPADSAPEAAPFPPADTGKLALKGSVQ